MARAAFLPCRLQQPHVNWRSRNPFAYSSPRVRWDLRPRLWHQGDAATVTSRSDLDGSTLTLLILPLWSAGFVGVYMGLAGKIYTKCFLPDCVNQLKQKILLIQLIFLGKKTDIEMPLTTARGVRCTSECRDRCSQTLGSQGPCHTLRRAVPTAQVNSAWQLPRLPKLFKMLVNIYECQMIKLYVLSLYSQKRTLMHMLFNCSYWLFFFHKCLVYDVQVSGKWNQHYEEEK